MNKVSNINLGGYPFIIDTDAYEQLAKYLNTIQDHFRSSDGYEEITSDIETRMAELFQERLEHRKIITVRDVNAAIDIMGTPEEFGAEPIEDDANYSYDSASEQNTDSSTNYKTGKRLFRNPDDEVVGGVASGIAAYFGIADPLWIRLALVIFTISGGFGIPLYILLWIILPQAKTAGDRLAMRGETINVSNIGKIVEEEAFKFSEKVSEWGDDINEKYGSGKKNTTFNPQQTKAFLRKGIRFIGSAFAIVINFIRSFGKPLLIIFAFILFFIFAVSWIGSIIGLFMAQPMIHYVTPDTPFLSYLGAFNFVMLLSIPLAAIVLFITRLLFKTYVPVGWKTGMWTFWTINLFCLLSIAGVTAKEFTAGTSVEHDYSELLAGVDHLTLQVDDSQNNFAGVNFGQLTLAGKDLITYAVWVDIEKSDSDQFEIIEERSSMGNSIAQANDLADDINYRFTIDDGVLNFKPNFQIPLGEKWRNQEIRLILKVPEGKKITIADQFTARQLWHYPLQDRHFRRSMVNEWVMQDRGLGCIDCQQEKEEKGIYGFQDFDQLEIDGLMKVTIEQGDDFNVRLDGRENYRKTVKFNQVDNKLKISTHLSETSSSLRLYITLPNLTAISATNTDDVKLTGFVEPRLSIENNGKNDLLADINVDSVYVTQHGKNEVDLRGSGHYIKANISDNARLDAERFSTRMADMTALDKSKIKITVSDTLYQNVGEHSMVSTGGEPLIISQNTNL